MVMLWLLGPCVASSSAAVWEANLTGSGARVPAPPGDPAAIKSAQVVFDDAAGTMSAVIQIAGPTSAAVNTNVESVGYDNEVEVDLAPSDECQGFVGDGLPFMPQGESGEVTATYLFRKPTTDATLYRASSQTSRSAQTIVTPHTVTILLNDPWLVEDPSVCATGESWYSSSQGDQSTTDRQFLGAFPLNQLSATGRAPLPTMTTADAGSLATTAVRTHLRAIRGLYPRCRAGTLTSATCQVSFAAPKEKWRGNVRAWFASSAHSISANTKLDLVGLPAGCRKRSCTNQLHSAS